LIAGAFVWSALPEDFGSGEKGFVIRRVGDIDVVHPRADVAVSFGDLLLKPLGVGKAARVGEDVNGMKGPLRKQSENRPVGKDTLHRFGIERIMIAGKSKKNIHQVIVSIESFC